MKKIFLIYLKKIISWLQFKYDSFTDVENDLAPYESLSPTDKGDPNNHYSVMLTKALKNRRSSDIKNIALTGPYGSGKSSILKTFQKNYVNTDLHFLNISLATFKEEDLNAAELNKDTTNPEAKSNLLRLIELSILQQIFYHEEDKNIPDSSFKKIKSIKKWEIRFFTGCFFLFILSWFYLSGFDLILNKIDWINTLLINNVFFYFISSIYIIVCTYLILIFVVKKKSEKFYFKLPISLIALNIIGAAVIIYKLSNIVRLSEISLIDSYKNSLLILSLLYITCFLISILYKSIRIISNINLTKFKFHDAEIEIDKKINKSILNHHIDEILYFFEVTEYNVVIIEDLDRFRTSEIFTKLREINFLLNNSKKTKEKDIVFIYAVRDEMFIDRDRTKFFDFIIPVIPIINSSNSSSKLLNKRDLNQYAISEDLIEDISLFIDDMRLLHNIMNEFHLYQQALENLAPDKLLAIIVYKNIDPLDFVLLSKNSGILYECLNSRNRYIKDQTDEIDLTLDSIRHEIKILETLKLTDVKELRSLYLLKAISHLSNFDSFVINSTTMSMDDMVLEENFAYLINDELKYNQVGIRNYNLVTNIVNIGYSFDKIEKEIGSKSYPEREKEIESWTTNKVNTLKLRMQKLENERLSIRTFKLKDILQNNTKSCLIEKTIKEIKKQNLENKIIEKSNDNMPLIRILLRNGYIAEDYLDYISIFHEGGSITKADNQFLLSVKSQRKLAHDYKLNRIEKVINKLNPLEFRTEYSFNYTLLDFILNSSVHGDYRDSIFIKLSDETPESISFIDGFIDYTANFVLFSKYLSASWPNIWQFIEEKSNYTPENKSKYLKNILEYAEISDLVKISQVSNLIQVILENREILNFISDQERLKNIIENLEIKFIDVNFESSPNEILDFIYNNNHYELNIELVKSFIKYKGDFNQVLFDTSNYQAIKLSKADLLISNIDNQINKYIEEVYFKIPTNLHEAEGYLIDLLNNENLDLSNKIIIISLLETKIIKLIKVNNQMLYSSLLDKNKLLPTWDNLLHAYNNQNIQEEEGGAGKEITESIITFINILENAKEISKTKIPKEVNSKNIYGEFYKKLIQRDDIDSNAYDLITKASPWWYTDLNFENLSESKIKLLIDNVCVSPVAKSFTALKENSTGFNIYLFEKRKTEFFKILDQITFDSDDLKLILESRILTNDEKMKILDICSDEAIITDTNLKIISSILNIDDNFVISEAILNAVLKNKHIPPLERIVIFNKNSSKYDNLFVGLFLIALGGTYSQIADTSTKAKIVKSGDNKRLLDILISKGYISSYSERDTYFRVNHKRK